MITTHYCIPTDQGTGTPETCLCVSCRRDPENVINAFRAARMMGDLDPKRADFVDCSDNEALSCVVCGKPAGQTMTAEHTPGPWKQGMESGHAMSTVYAYEGGIILCEVNTSAPEDGECEANARLIAAAPGLLEALRLCRNILCAKGGPSAKERALGAATARIAIAKATN